MKTFLSSLPVAHRGLHDALLPENSMSAFRAAARAGYAIETDVRLSKDGKLFLFHDDSLARMTGENRAFLSCGAAELSALRLEGKEKIPLLGELLEELAGKVPLLLEIKNVPEVKRADFLPAIAAAFSSYQGEYAVQSFQPFYVRDYKRLCPDIPCGVLGCAHSQKSDFGNSAIWRIKAHAVKNMSFNKRVKPDFISYELAGYPQKSTEKFGGIKLAWTVRSKEDEALARRYADNIIFEGYLPKI